MNFSANEPMTVLLDTNVFLWSITGQQSKISSKAFQVLEDPYNNRWLSSVSLWEIAIKVGTGKLNLPGHADFLKTHMALLRIGRVLAVEAVRNALADFSDYSRHHRFYPFSTGC